MNAFTTHEQTVFYVRVPDAQLELAFDILADVLWQPGVPARRRRVGAAGDPRRDRDARRHARRPRARPVRAARCSPSTRSVARCSAATRRSRRCRATTSPTYHARALPTRRTSCSPRPATSPTTTVARAASSRVAAATDARPPERAHADAPAPQPRRGRATAPTEQAHVVLGVRVARRARPRPVRADGREPGARRRHVVAAVPGDPRGARPRVLRVLVPRRVRRHRASSRSTRAPRPSACRRRSTSIDAELDRLVDDGLTDAELDAAKGHLEGSLAMSLETSASRMRRLGRSELDRGRDPERSTSSSRAIDGGHAPTTSRRVDRPRASPTRRATLAVVGPHRREPTSRRPLPERRSTVTLPAMIRVGVFGAGGRMGSTVCEAVHRRARPASSSPRSTRTTRASISAARRARHRSADRGRAPTRCATPAPRSPSTSR